MNINKLLTYRVDVYKLPSSTQKKVIDMQDDVNFEGVRHDKNSRLIAKCFFSYYVDAQTFCENFNETRFNKENEIQLHDLALGTYEDF